MDPFQVLSDYKHENLVYCFDGQTGLKAWIAVHDTTLGPALGGTRMWSYENEADAVTDVLRLSRGMTYKASIAGLNLGGGKAVILGDARTLKNEVLMRRFGQFVETLQGNYITAEDVGMSEQDMVWINQETKHVTGVPIAKGGNGDPSPVTAYTTYMGMKAAAKKAYGSDSLNGKRVLVQGCGHVGQYLIDYLHKEGAAIAISDIFEDKLKAVTAKLAAEIVQPDEVFDYNMDIYAPCALGATLNEDSLKKLKARVVAGAANNQFKDEKKDGEFCMNKGIIYAPDFLINSGGLINVYCEYIGESKEQALKRAEYVYSKTLEVLNESEESKLPAQQIATSIAESRINQAK